MLWREDELEILGSGGLDERLLPSMNSLNAGDVNTGLTDSGPRLSWTTRPSNGDNPDRAQQKTTCSALLGQLKQPLKLTPNHLAVDLRNLSLSRKTYQNKIPNR